MGVVVHVLNPSTRVAKPGEFLTVSGHPSVQASSRKFRAVTQRKLVSKNTRKLYL